MNTLYKNSLSDPKLKSPIITTKLLGVCIQVQLDSLALITPATCFWGRHYSISGFTLHTIKSFQFLLILFILVAKAKAKNGKNNERTLSFRQKPSKIYSSKDNKFIDLIIVLYKNIDTLYLILAATLHRGSRSLSFEICYYWVKECLCLWLQCQAKYRYSVVLIQWLSLWT